jgi:uncharacterized protein (TIGR02598 family)
MNTQRNSDARVLKKKTAVGAVHSSQISPRGSCGFSLVEVTLAIGIISFALLSVVALLPIGLQTVKNTNEQVGAANVINGIATALRSAKSQDGTNYTATYAGKTINFSLATTSGGSSSQSWSDLTLLGQTNSQTRRLVAQIDILQFPKADMPGRASVSVAWSAQRNPRWNPSTQTWTNADGALTSGIQFLPKRL